MFQACSVSHSARFNSFPGGPKLAETPKIGGVICDSRVQNLLRHDEGELTPVGGGSNDPFSLLIIVYLRGWRLGRFGGPDTIE